METIESVRGQLNELRLKELALECQDYKRRILPKIKAAVGKAFVYRNNSYGGDGRWDTYRQLITASLGRHSAWLIFEQCQIDSDGRAYLSTESELVSTSSKDLPHLVRGWVECPTRKYAVERKRTLAALANPKRFITHLRSS